MGKRWAKLDLALAHPLCRLSAHALSLLPLLLWLDRIWRDRLGADPVAELTHASGDWALRLLLICLAMTPLRRLSGLNAPLRYRRMFGLYAFVYASLHLLVYLLLDLGSYWTQIVADILERPFITLGFTAWLLLLPLAATSTRTAQRALGRRWQQLHRLVYPAAVLAIAHFIWLVKSDLREPLLYAAILLILLALRWPPRRRTASTRPGRAEVPER